MDAPMKVIADTTAMSKPHEIEYELTFDSSSIKATSAKLWVLMGAVGLMLIAGGAMTYYFWKS